MKKLICALIVMSLLVFLGCTPGPKSVENYMDVSIDGFTTGIPVDWEEEDVTEDPEVAELIRESQGGYAVAMYGDVSESALVMVMLVNMERLYELEGESWESWQQVEEVEDMSKRELSIIFSSYAMFEAENVTRKEVRMLTIDNKDVSELIYSCEIEGIPTNVNLLVIFGENKLGIIMFAVKEVAWPTFQECWPIIRDSTRLR